MGKALVEAFKKEGFNPILSPNPTDAMNQFKVQGAHAFIIDCLLPKMSGVEFAAQLRQEGAPTAPIFLMSGVFKDKAFVKESIEKTGALQFFTKPLNILEVIKSVTTALSDFIDTQQSPAESLLTNTLSPGEKIKIINQIGEAESLDLPFLYCLLMNGVATGVLKLDHAQNPVHVSFSEGKIVQVEMKNPESIFGNLLIENGYITLEQLEEALKHESKKRIGERLVDLNLLSPHTIDIVNAEQMADRLSMSINQETYKVSFEEKPIANTSSFINQESLAPFLIDWLNSKFNLAWLKQKYLKWEEKPIHKTTLDAKWARLWSFPIFKNLNQIVKSFEQGQTIEAVMSKNEQNEEGVLQVFHLLLITEHIKFKNENIKVIDLTAHFNRLKKILADLKNQDYFAVLGISKNAKPSDIKKTYHELAKIFHPDKLPSNASSELKVIAQEVFSLMTKAYEVLSNDAKRTSYIKEIEMGRAEKILQAEALFEEGKAILTTGQAQKALDKFKLAQSLKPPSSDLLVHIAWALLVSSEQNKASSQVQEAAAILTKIAPEDRHNASYYFVKGFYQKMSGDFVAAKKNVLHAISLKPRFIEAERLLRFLEMQKSSKTVDILNSDLKDVVGSLFKKS